MTFSLDLQRFAEKAKDRADDAVGEIVIGVAGRVDERSPVGNPSLWKSPPPKGYVGGHFRANWQLGVETMPLSELPGIDPTGEATQGAIKAKVPDRAAGKVYYLMNNTPYAQRLEDGWSTQSDPGEMVGRTVVEYQQIVRAAVEQLA